MDKKDTLKLMTKMGIDEGEITRRKEWLKFTDEDTERLTALNNIAQGYMNDVIESLYEHFLEFEETRKFFEDPEVLNHVKTLQKEYFMRLTQGNYDSNYIEN
ncbi:MAG: transcriptional regulator, partial [Gammaproteobacteria bacterium]